MYICVKFALLKDNLALQFIRNIYLNNMKTDISQIKKTQKKNIIQLAIWTWGWVAATALATFGPKFLWQDNDFLNIGSMGLYFITGFGMIIANRKQLMGLDELQRKIQLEGMALALGVAVVVGLGYSILDIENYIHFDAEISHLVVLIGLTYFSAVLINTKRYK